MAEEWVDQKGQEWRALTIDEVHEYLALQRGVWEGYCEARESKPFDPFRFAEEQIDQVRYEDGRRMCALIMGREGHAPEWTVRWKPPALLINTCIDEMRKHGSML